jgi:hypothetical protein
MFVFLAPWFAIGFSLLGRDDLQRTERAARSFAVVVGVSLVVGSLGDDSMAGPFVVGIFGIVPGGIAFMLARGRLTRQRLSALVVLGALVTFGALVSSGVAVVLVSWVNSWGEFLRVQAPLQLPFLGCAALGALLALWAYRARLIAGT